MSSARTGGARVALRVARREAWRHPWRSLLVVALVAVPVAGMVLATTFIRTDARTPVEEWNARYGAADIVAYLPRDGSGLPPDVAAVIAGAESTTRYEEGYSGFRTDGTTARVQVVGADLGHELWAGRFDLRSGQRPHGDREVALSARLADRFGVTAGDRLVLERPDAAVLVSGVVEDQQCLHCEVAYHELGADSPVGSPYGSGRELLVDLGAPDPAVLQPFLFSGSGQVRPLPALDTFTGGDSAGDGVAWAVVIGALVVAVVGIVIAAAFAAGSRGQLVSLGLLSAAGAPQRVLRRVLFLQGTVTGLAGTIVGMTASGTALLFGEGSAERLLDRRINGFEIGVAELVAIAAVGTIGATIAALVPARPTAQTPTLQSLAGRRPVEPVTRGFTVRGIGSMGAGFLSLVVAAAGANGRAGGTLFALVAIVGGSALLFGAAALTPAMVQRAELLVGGQRGATRLAGRGLARNRTRSGAIVAAVAAAGALAIGGTALARGVESRQTHHMELPEDVVRLEQFGTEPHQQQVPAATVRKVTAALSEPTVFDPPLLLAPGLVSVRGVDYGFGGDRVLVVGPELADAVELPDGVQHSLERDGAVLLSFNSDRQQRVVINLPGVGNLEADLVFAPHGLTDAGGLLVTPTVGERMLDAGAEPVPGPVIVRDGDGINDIELFDIQELQAAQEAHADSQPAMTSITYGIESTAVDQSLIEVGLAALSVVFALFIVAIGLALAAADDRLERQQLAVAGAGPATLSKIAAWQAAILAFAGFVLAVPVGFLPVVAVTGVLDRSATLAFPIDTVTLLLAGVPALAYLGARAITQLARHRRPIQLAQAGFD